MKERTQTQTQRLDYLIEELKAESDSYRHIRTPEDEGGKQRMLRSLMNVRMPKELPTEVWKVQDAYLQEYARERGIVQLSDIPLRGEGLSVWQGDITRLAVDAIVNAANGQMLGCFIPLHACIDNCIHSFAGLQLREECNRQMQEKKIRYGKSYEQPTSVPMLTEAYNLPASKVIHIVGPIVQPRLLSEHEKQLTDCYRNILHLCLEQGLKTLAFCCISTGVFRFPKQRAAEIAVRTVREWMKEHPGAMERVIFNVFEDEDRGYYEKLLP